jgi:ABC-type uncharacterized transport system fused permease/ATPase subunit
MSTSIACQNRNTERWAEGRQTAGSAVLGDLITGLADDLATLVGLEFRLARSELQAQAARGARGVLQLLLGLCLAVAGLVTLMGAMSLGYGVFLPFWFACFVVGLLFLIFGIMVLYVARRLLSSLSMAPKQTAAALRTDLVLLKEKATGATTDVAAHARASQREQAHG